MRSPIDPAAGGEVLFEAGPPGLLVDRAGIIVRQNRRSLSWVGDAVGRALREVAESADLEVALAEASSESETRRPVVLRGPSGPLPAHLHATRLDEGLFVWFSPRASDAHLALLARTSQQLTVREGAAVHGVFAEVAEALGFEIFLHFEADEDARTLRLAASHGLTDAEREAFATVPFGVALCGYVAAERAPVVWEDDAERFAELVAQSVAGVRCYIGVPLIAHGRVLGTFACGTRARTRLRDGEREVIQAVCDQAAIQLARQRSEQAARERDTYLHLAMEASNAIVFAWEIRSDVVHLSHHREWVQTRPEPVRFADAVEAIHPDDRARFRAAVDRALTSPDGKYQCEFRAARSGHWLSETGRVEFGPDGEPMRLVGVNLDVTDVRATREQLRDREHQLALVLRAGQLGIWDWDPRTDRVVIDPPTAQMLGHTVSEMPSTMTGLSALVHPDDLDAVARALADHLSGRTDFYECELRLRHADGSWRWILDRGQVIERDADGQPLRVLGTHADMTPRRRAVDALRQIEHQLTAVMRAGPLGVGVFDRELRYVHVNPALAKMNRISAEDHLGRTPREVLGEGASYFEGHLRKVIESGQPVLDHEITVNILGRTRSYVAQYIPVHDPATGEQTGVSCVVSDVSRRKQDEERLRESEERFRNLFEHAAFGILLSEPGGALAQVNAAFAGMAGIPHDLLKGRQWLTLLHPDDQDDVRAAVDALLARERVLAERDARLVRPDGETIWVHLAVSALRDQIMALVSDVDARRSAEQNATFLSDMSAALARVGTSTEVVSAAARAVEERFPGVHAHFMDVGADEDTIVPLRASRPPVRLSQVASAEVTAATRAGTVTILDDLASDPRATALAARWGPGRVVSVPHRTGGALRFILFLQDPTRRSWRGEELALLEELVARVYLRLARTRAQEALEEEARRKDEFLAMLAHELRNPLAPIRNAVHLLGREGLEDDGRARARSMIERQVAHLARLVDDLLDVSRVSRGKITLQRAPVDLAAVVRQAVETNRGLIDERRHQLAVRLPREPVLVDGDLTRLAQVVGNLLNNAAKYSDEAGWIDVLVEADVPGEAVILVRDGGRGIDPSALGSLFELFYQAERNLDRSEGGLGIGLSLVKSLVELHGGRVEAHSDGRGRGSEFTVTLPRLQQPEHAEPPEEAPAAQGAPLRVLVVDDLVDTAESLALLLELDGHVVWTAGDGASAVEVAAQEHPDVVLLDIGLPKMDGYQACRAMREAGLDARIIALTGYGQDEDRRKSTEAGFDDHLVKPVDPDLLRDLLR